MDTAQLTDMLLERVKLATRDIDPIDPYATKIDGENAIGIEDPETGAMFFVTVTEA